jgi:hypothetical protein
MHRKVRQDTLLALYGNYMHWGFPCSKEKLASATLHEVVPQALLQRPSPAESLLRRRAYMR